MEGPEIYPNTKFEDFILENNKVIAEFDHFQAISISFSPFDLDSNDLDQGQGDQYP